ncbi:hypothetical protein [Streptomyces sp. KL116D]|uniref:hypothetical protein n=1 Tax=Streptomyces sp. KL116D TaxID=3045152 RepID=UPI003558C610
MVVGDRWGALGTTALAGAPGCAPVLISDSYLQRATAANLERAGHTGRGCSPRRTRRRTGSTC